MALALFTNITPVIMILMVDKGMKKICIPLNGNILSTIFNHMTDYLIIMIIELIPYGAYCASHNSAPSSVT